MTCPKCGRETTASHLKWAEGPGDKRHEVREKLDNEAAIAATKADRQWNATLGPQTRSNYRSGFRDGYRDAATLREKEIAYLSDARSRELQVLVKYLRQIKERDAEIATLRARVEELEGMVPKWADANEAPRLEDLGWLRAYDDKCGDDPRMWLMCMAPPIPVPETKP